MGPLPIQPDPIEIPIKAWLYHGLSKMGYNKLQETLPGLPNMFKQTRTLKCWIITCFFDV